MSAPSRPASRSRRRALWWLLLALVVLVVALGVLALPFRAVPGDANAAKAALVAARDAVAEGDAETARAQAARAREHVDSLQESVQGTGGDVWSKVPVVGGAVSDVRHLGDALSELTDVAAVGVETVDRMEDPQRPMMAKKRIDLEVLDEVLADVATIDEALVRARADLDEVADSRLLVGARLGEARDEAREVVDPVSSSLETARPVLKDLPEMLGADGRRRYMVAMLNQTEMRYSGGAPLTLAVIRANEGKLFRWGPVDALDLGTFDRLNWKPVKGNVFHRPDTAISGATYAPSWSVSGEELARAWETNKGERLDGVVVVDVTALADLLTVTGPVEAEGYGTLRGEELVHTVLGSYDEFAEDNGQRKVLNRALVPTFADQMFSSTEMLPKLQSLGRSASGRHFAVWMRKPAWQDIVRRTDLDGDLSTTEHDYLGVFNQNVNASKADLWLHRSASTDVTLQEDGSATVRLKVRLHNDSPPWPFPTPDPKGNSFVTRWNGMALTAFLPEGAKVRKVVQDGTVLPDPWTGKFFGRPWLRTDVTLEPGGRSTVVATYTVPSAAVVGEDGSLEYRLAMDPHTLLNPEGRSVTVHFPGSMRVSSVPEGWTKDGSTARYEIADLTNSVDFTVVAKP